jgi:pimeloyl-ACP methyl ester carboxylesterase
MKTVLRNSSLLLVVLSLVSKPLPAAWPPRDSTQGFKNPCVEALFFSGILAELAAREREQEISRLEAAKEHDQAASLRLQNASDRALLAGADALFEGKIGQWLEAMDGGISLFQVFQMLGSGPFTPGWHLGQNLRGEPYFNKQLYPVLQSEFKFPFQTPFYFSRKGFVAENTRLVVPAIGGVGAEFSHSGSVFALLNLLLSDSAKKLGTVAELKADPNYMRVNAFAFDLPNNGGAFRSTSFTGLEENISWLADALTSFGSNWRQELGQPLIAPIVRSASPSLLMQMHQTFPSLLKGMLAVSPLHPLDLENGNKTLKVLAQQGYYKPNEEANHWIDTLYEQMTWHEKEDPFLNDLPVLILVGTNDTEETDALEPKLGWDIYREWERKFPNKVRFIIVEGAGHDLFAIRDKEILHKVMKYVYRFFQFVLNGEKDMAAAFPIEPGEIRAPWKTIFWKDKKQR